MRLLLISLLLSFVLTNCPTEEDTDFVEMQAAVNPEEAGEVNPPLGTYISGREITVTTSPADSQWQFTGWTGDTTAQEDSLTFVITQDMQLVANYEIPSGAYYEFVVTPEPDAGGTVEPASGTLESGTSVEVEAIPNDGWEFIDWSGDTSATSNPLTLTIHKDYNITANFNELPQSFSNQVTISDGINSKNVVFGMHPDATAGFDNGIDVELPNIRPPDGAFYRRFNIPDYALQEDYRAVQEEQAVWEMEFAPEEGQSITITWDFSETAHIGTLTLTDDLENPTFELDMKSNSSYDVTDTSVNTLYIISN